MLRGRLKHPRRPCRMIQRCIALNTTLPGIGTFRPMFKILPYASRFISRCRRQAKRKVSLPLNRQRPSLWRAPRNRQPMCLNLQLLEVAVADRPLSAWLMKANLLAVRGHDSHNIAALKIGKSNLDRTRTHPNKTRPHNPAITLLSLIRTPPRSTTNLTTSLHAPTPLLLRHPLQKMTGINLVIENQPPELLRLGTPSTFSLPLRPPRSPSRVKTASHCHRYRPT